MAITFTQEEVDAAYRATGLTPARETWLGDWAGDEDFKLACPIGALLTKRCGGVKGIISKLRARGMPNSDLPEILEFTQLAVELLGMTPLEVNSFINGFDNGSRRPEYDQAAYAFGQRLNEHLLHDDEDED